jgi:large subunit ribosomal protein L23
MKLETILLKPVLTEKSSLLVKEKKYMFEVSEKANKDQIQYAVENLFNVKVGSVRIVIRKGKERKTGKRMKVKKLADRKIGIITLKEGKIDLFPQT